MEQKNKFEGYKVTINEVRRGLVDLANEKTITDFIVNVFQESPIPPRDLVNFMNSYLELIAKQQEDALKELDKEWENQVKTKIVHGGEEADVIFAEEKK